MWDLADAIVECALSPARETELLTAYFERAPSAVELGRVAIYKALCNLLWALWGYVQMQQKGQQTEFDAYAQHRFKRSQALMSDPMFAQHLKAVGG
jgi:thiamine kinase-like enzyme